MHCSKCDLDLPLHKFTYLRKQNKYASRCRDCSKKLVGKSTCTRTILSNYFGHMNEGVRYRAYKNALKLG